MGFSQDRPTLKGRHVPGEKTKFKYCPATIESGVKLNSSEGLSVKTANHNNWAIKRRNHNRPASMTKEYSFNDHPSDAIVAGGYSENNNAEFLKEFFEVLIRLFPEISNLFLRIT